MVKKIKFSLEMGNGVKVRTLKDLRENFNMQKILSYYVDGKLQIWLKDRYYDSEYKQILELDSKKIDFNKNLLEVLGIDPPHLEEININIIEKQSKKLSKLRLHTTDKDIIQNINNVVFNQEELVELIKTKTNKVYLCGEEFFIPLNKENITYIGVNNPTVIFENAHDLNFDKKNIILDSVHLTCKEKTRIIAHKSRQISIDNNRIKVGLNFNKIISVIDIEKNNWYDKKIYLYKDYIIIVSSRDFEIYNIHNGQKVISFDDIKEDYWHWSFLYDTRVISQIFKNYIIMFFQKNEMNDSKLMLFNLDTLKVDRIVDTPDGYGANSNVYTPDYIDVYDSNIVLYQRLSIDGLGEHEIKHQYHNFQSLDYLKSEKFNFEEIKSYRARTFGNVYLGHTYRFSASNMNLVSTNKEYECKGFLKDGESRRGAIGKFIVYSDKIVATHSETRFSYEQYYESVVDIGEFAIYNLSGGYPLKIISVSDKKITDLIHIENTLVVLCKESNEIFFYDDTNFELLNKVSLDLSLGIWSKSEAWVCDIYIDTDNYRMATSYNGIVTIYE